MKPKNTLRLLGMVGLLLVASCASKKAFGPNREALATASQMVNAGDRQGAVARLEKLLVDSATDEKTYVLQRYFAAYLLTRAHAEAAFDEPFLPGPDHGNAGFSVDASGSGQGSAVANLVASTYFAGYGANWYRAASGAKQEVGGEALLPENLSSLGTRNAMVHINLVLLTAYSRFQFQERIIGILEDMPELRTLEGCDRLLADARIGDSMRPWIYRGIFEQLKRTDEIAAYKFAIRVLNPEAGVAPPSTSVRRNLSEWVTTTSKYSFKCGTCRTDVNPDLAACPICGKPNIEFEPEEKVAGSGG